MEIGKRKVKMKKHHRSQVRSRVAARSARLLLLFILPFSLSPLQSASADQVKVNGIWQPQVEIVSVGDGRIQYVTSTGTDVELALDQVEGLRLDKYPDYAKAVDLLNDGKTAEAVPLLTSVRRAARGSDAWVANDAGMKLAVAQDAAGNAAAAVEAYVELVNAKAPPAYLAAPPVTSVAALAPADRARLEPVVARALREVDRDSRPQVQVLMDTVREGAAAAPEPPAGGTPTPGSPATPGLGGTSGGGAAGIGATAGPYPDNPDNPLPERVGRSELADLVAAGEYREAVTMAEGLMKSLPRAETIFLKAKAELALAEQSRDDKLFKDAALDFMRVVIYFPEPYGGPSLVEVAYIHEKLGLTEKAAELYDAATRALDTEAEPRYAARLQRLTGN